MTGWGQDGPMAAAAGHDINYIALAGVLHSIGRRGGAPAPPLNLVGDFGGGGMYLAFGVVCALLEARRSGRGQVVDAAMVDGAASLAAAVFGLRAKGMWNDERGDNILDSGAPWYDVYETQDGKYVAIGSIEEPVLRRAAAPHRARTARRSRRSGRRRAGASCARGSPRCSSRRRGTSGAASWRAATSASRPCSRMTEAPAHPHNRARGTFVEVDGVAQPGPAPRFSRTPGAIARPPARAGQHTEEALRDWGFSADDLAALRADGAIA